MVNHFLLLTIGKGVDTALHRACNQLIPTRESDLKRLAPIGDPSAFPWEPPGHMIPTGTACGTWSSCANGKPTTRGKCFRTKKLHVSSGLKNV